jgi:hypothetical protein
MIEGLSVSPTHNTIDIRLQVDVRLVRSYGKEKFYPANDLAELLCKLLKHKSLTRDELLLCKEHGWLIKIIQDEYVL